jgi:glucokinase
MTPDGGPVALGIDVGGTKVAAALVAGDGTVLARERGAVAPESNEAGLAGIFAVADRLLAACPDAGRRLAGTGVGVAGSVDWRSGVHAGATNLAWRDLPLGAALRERYGVPALVDNDVNVAAWGERCFGGGSGAAKVPYDNLVFITVGTGIGSGLIEGGRIVRGRRAAGEIGHIPLIEDGPRCRCGMVGCLEAVAAGPALAAVGRRLAEAGRAPRLVELAGGDLEAIEAPLVIQAATEGDPGARAALDREGYYLALAALVAGRMLDPELIVVGGGLAEAGAPLFTALWDHLARLRPRGPDPRAYVLPARLGADAGAVGAAALILRPEPGFVAAGLIAA